MYKYYNIFHVRNVPVPCKYVVILGLTHTRSALQWHNTPWDGSEYPGIAMEKTSGHVCPNVVIIILGQSLGRVIVVIVSSMAYPLVPLFFLPLSPSRYIILLYTAVEPAVSYTTSPETSPPYQHITYYIGWYTNTVF